MTTHLQMMRSLVISSLSTRLSPPPLLRFPWPFFPLLGLFIPGRPAGRMNRGTEGEDEPSTKGAAPLLRDLHLCCCRGAVNTEHLVGLYKGRKGSRHLALDLPLPSNGCLGLPVHIIVTTTLEEVPLIHSKWTVGGSC